MTDWHCATGCGRPVLPRWPLCDPCWGRVPTDVQRGVDEAWRAYQRAGRGGIDVAWCAYRAAYAAAVEAAS